GCVFSPDGKLLISDFHMAGSDGIKTKMEYWEVATGKRMASFDEDNLFFGLAFSADGKMMASGTIDFSISIWDVTSRKKTATLKAKGTLNHCAFSPDGSILASAGQSHEIELWEVSTGKELPSISNDQTKLKHERGTYALAFSPDGKTIATSDI